MDEGDANLTVALIVVGAAEAFAVEAALLQESFWLEHSSTEKPGAEIPTQAVY